VRSCLIAPPAFRIARLLSVASQSHGGDHGVPVSHRQVAVDGAFLVWGSLAHAIDVWTVGVNNTRQGWNQFETVLTPANVPRLRKLREFVVDEKIDVTPLVVGDKLYVCTMTNTVFVFDVNTGAELVRRQLAAPFDPRPDPGQMDRWKLYHNWGITATPVIDVATSTIYVTTFGKPNVDSENTERNNMLFILDATTLADKAPPVLIAGEADNGGGAIANGFTTPYQKLRAGLGLLSDTAGSKAVIVSFSINGENPRGPATASSSRTTCAASIAKPGSRPRQPSGTSRLAAAPAACGCQARALRSTATTSISPQATEWIPARCPATSARVSSSCAIRLASRESTTESQSSS
jgi:hypothetical protein